MTFEYLQKIKIKLLKDQNNKSFLILECMILIPNSSNASCSLRFQKWPYHLRICGRFHRRHRHLHRHFQVYFDPECKSNYKPICHDPMKSKISIWKTIIFCLTLSVLSRARRTSSGFSSKSISSSASKFQIRTVLSYEDETMKFSVAISLEILPVCPLKLKTHSQVVMSHFLIELSAEPEIIYSWQTAKAVTYPVWPLKMKKKFTYNEGSE